MLKQFVSVYVPGTHDISHAIDSKKRALIVDNIARRLSSKFGGATSTSGIGYYVSNTGQLIREKITIVKSYHDHDPAAALEYTSVLARELCHELTQESVTIETNDGIDFIS